MANSKGISIYFTVTSITQVHAIHVGYIAWTSTNLKIVDGEYMM